MHRMRYGEEKEISMDEPCFDMERKEYIMRYDADAENYQVHKRSTASVARSAAVKENLKKPEFKKPRQLSLYQRGEK